MSTETHPEAAGLAETIWLADDRWQHGIGAGGFAPPETAWDQALAHAALSWLAARLTDDDVVEAVADALVMDPLSSGFSTQIEPVRRAARAALAAAADVIGGER